MKVNSRPGGRRLIASIVGVMLLCGFSQAGASELEIALDGSWSVANTAQDGESPRMVAIKIDEQREGNSPMLAITCSKPHGVLVYINWSGGRILPENRRVTWRVDDETERRADWTLSSDGYVTFFPQPDAVTSELQSPLAFAEKLARSETLKASIIIGRETPRIARFRLSGTARALKQVRAGCGLGKD